jgi:hypothetical protein
MLLLARVIAGLAVTAVACGALGRLWTEHPSATWWSLIAGVLATGLYLVFSGLRQARARSSRAGPAPHSDSDAPGEVDVLMPMLGALLVYKHRVITEGQLQKALGVQGKERKHRRRLGEILLDMGAVNRSQLKQALDHQQAYAREKRKKRQNTSSLPAHS